MTANNTSTQPSSSTFSTASTQPSSIPFRLPSLSIMKNPSKLHQYVYQFSTKKENVQFYINLFNSILNEGKLRNHWLREVTTERKQNDPTESLRGLTLHELQYYIWNKTQTPLMNYYPAMTEPRIHFLFLARDFATQLCM